MAANTIQVEVGDQIIKLCRVARRGKGVRLSGAFSFRTPNDCVADGVITNAELLGQELRQQLKLHKLGSVRSVAFSLSSSRIAVREVKLPLMREKLLAKAIETNAEDYFPVDLKNYRITYTVLEVVKGPESFMRVMVLAVPVTMLEGYFQLAAQAGLTISAVDSSGNGQYQALRALPAKDGVTIYVDVNFSSSIVSFIHDGNLLLQRTFAFGADELIAHYISVSGKGSESYLSAIRETDITSPDFSADKLLSQADIQESLSRLVGGIVRSVSFFNSSQWEIPATRVVLMGANRHIVGLRELVAEATGLETIYLDEVAEFSAFTGGAADAAVYISCIGSALAPLKLVGARGKAPGAQTGEGKEASVKTGALLFVLLFLAAAGLAGFSLYNYNGLLTRLNSTNAEIASLQPAEELYQTYLSYQQGEEALNAVSASTDTPNARLEGFFSELEQKMPASILILSASCDNEAVSMNITVADYPDAAAVISELRGFESLATLTVGELTREENELGVERVSFSISCTYGENPYVNNINPYASLIEPAPAEPAPTESAPEQAQQ